MRDAAVLSGPAFRAQFESLLRRFPRPETIDYTFIELPSDRKPWCDTGIDLAVGERVTTFAAGRTFLKGTDLWFGPDFQLWLRVGTEGEVFRGTRASHSFTVDQPGRLHVASYFPGEWASRNGALATPEDVYEQAEGCLTVLILRWQTDTVEGLKALAALGDVEGLIASEIDRLSHPVPVPAGWNYLWFVGPAEIYRPCEAPERRAAICCHTHRDVGLLQRDVDLPLRPDTRLRWSWRMDRLPSSVREDQLATHDYLSIAVEFDNGQDLTYFWSAELAVDTGFRCPIPTWTARETHVVARTGSEQLGQWCGEERNVYDDYAKHIGGVMPERIVRVWLIAVSLFQGNEGDCRYADIALSSEGRVIPVQ